jgi:hypothetical protein
MNGVRRLRCAGCESGFDHCHGTLVVHVDGAAECTDPSCDDTDQLRHDLAVDCPSTVIDCCEPRQLSFTALTALTA